MITLGDHQRLLHITGALPEPALCRKKQSLKFGVGAEKHLFKNTFVGARPCHKHRALIAAEREADFALLSWISLSSNQKKSWIFRTGILENAKNSPAGLCHESTWVVNLPSWAHMWCWSVTANITSHPVSRQTQLPMNWSYTSQRENSGMWRVRITEAVRNSAFNLRQQMLLANSFPFITSQLYINIGKLKTRKRPVYATCADHCWISG